MKSLIIIIFLLFSLLGSALVVGQTKQTQSSKTMPQSIIDLEQALASVDRSKNDRNSRLRLERAEFYFQHAVKYHQADWHAKAVDFAQRGALLVELHQRDLGLPGFYRPHLAKAQKVAAQKASYRNN
jgi:hypothetical protein